MTQGTSQRCFFTPLRKVPQITTALRQGMHYDLQRAGLGTRTQGAYLRAVRQLADDFSRRAGGQAGRRASGSAGIGVRRASGSDRFRRASGSGGHRAGIGVRPI